MKTRFIRAYSILLLVALTLSLAAALTVPAHPIAAQSAERSVTLQIERITALDLQEDAVWGDHTDEIALTYSLRQISSSGRAVGTTERRQWGPRDFSHGTVYRAASFPPLRMDIAAGNGVQVSLDLKEHGNGGISSFTSDQATERFTDDRLSRVSNVTRSITFEWHGMVNHAKYEVEYSLIPSPAFLAPPDTDIDPPEIDVATTAGCDWNAAPYIGPDIIFSADCDGDMDLYVLRGDGTVTQLTDDPATDSFPLPAPDGTQIAFASERDGAPAIYIMDRDGDAVRALSLTQNPNLEIPYAWSPDGTQLLVLQVPADDSQPGMVMIVNTDDSGLGRLGEADEQLQAAVWSPDGAQVAFAVQEAASSDALFIMNRDGTQRQRISHGERCLPSQWTAQGLLVVLGEGDAREIYLIDPASGERQRLTDNQREEISPLWAPDGSAIVFSAEVDTIHELFMMNPDGSGVRRLTENSVTEWWPRPLPDPATEDLGAPTLEGIEIGAVEITESRLEAVVDIQTFELSNCHGSRAVSGSKTLTRSVEREIRFGGEVSASVEGDIWSATARGHAEAAIQAYLDVQLGMELTESTTIEMEADPGTTVYYEAEWLEVSTRGRVEVIAADGSVTWVEFTVPQSLQMNVRNSYQEPCPPEE